MIRYDVNGLALVPLLSAGSGEPVNDREIDVGTNVHSRVTDGSGYSASNGAAAENRDHEQDQEEDGGRKHPSS